MGTGDAQFIRQHLIDPEICIRCNTCEVMCPTGAVSHGECNYVVDADKCNYCMACIAPCPTGSIDNWRVVPRTKAYTIAAQLAWDVLPEESASQPMSGMPGSLAPSEALIVSRNLEVAEFEPSFHSVQYGATLPPWSAAHAYTNIYGPKSPEKSVMATVTGNIRVTDVGREYDTHHIVLDFGNIPFPVLEGQSIGILPPGTDAEGRPHHARQYSVASPRDGERPGYGNISLTIKRVLEDHQGRPVHGVASNYMCDLRVGDKVQVIGPFGTSFLMPNHPGSSIVMICTGTGSAPMRAMTERRRRLRKSSRFEAGKLMLFFGARTKEELPYFGPLHNLPKDFIDINFAFSRTPGCPKRYVQDEMRERSDALVPLLADPNAFFYVCGLKSMGEGVVLALRDIAEQGGLSWEAVAASLKKDGRLHLETY